MELDKKQILNQLISIKSRTVVYRSSHPKEARMQIALSRVVIKMRKRWSVFGPFLLQPPSTDPTWNE